MPNTLKEMATSIACYESLVAEVPIIEATFPPITDQMKTLGV